MRYRHKTARCSTGSDATGGGPSPNQLPRKSSASNSSGSNASSKAGNSGAPSPVRHAANAARTSRGTPAENEKASVSSVNDPMPLSMFNATAQIPPQCGFCLLCKAKRAVWRRASAFACREQQPRMAKPCSICIDAQVQSTDPVVGHELQDHDDEPRENANQSLGRCAVDRKRQPGAQSGQRRKERAGGRGVHAPPELGAPAMKRELTAYEFDRSEREGDCDEQNDDALGCRHAPKPCQSHDAAAFAWDSRCPL